MGCWEATDAEVAGGGGGGSELFLSLDDTEGGASRSSAGLKPHIPWIPTEASPRVVIVFFKFLGLWWGVRRYSQ